MASAPLKVGAFELRNVIGRGAMAEVWRAVHETQGIPVAVKVIDQQHAQNPTLHRMLYNEARAMAGLHHPGIAMVYDIGRTAEGSPWIAMELASGGTLDALVDQPVAWSPLKELLLSLLDALAHAHARGVLHRDLKPANLLLCTSADLRPGLKVSDFGLAMPRTSAKGSNRVSGTPAFMSPEQARGLWRDFGPWSDLYAVGCLAWQLACGTLPLHGDTLEEWLTAHVELKPRPFTPRVAVPDELEWWLLRMLDKSPMRRYRSAADAAWGLLQMKDLPTGELPVWEGETAPLEPSVNTTVIGLLQASSVSDLNKTVPLPRPESPPLMREWRRDDVRAPMRMLGAGLGLYAFRRAPLVGRDEERDALWAQLFGVVQDNRARAIVVEGGAGVGKSRLVRWIVQRAEEVGAATVLRSMQHPIPGPEDGVGGMLSRTFRTQGLSRDDVHGRAARGLRSLGIPRDDAAHAITELICGGELLFSPRERWEVVGELLEALSWRRPVILWIDDAQWAHDALELTRHVLERQQRHPSPLLIIISGRTVLSDQANSVALKPLPDQDHVVLVQELLGMEETLSEEVARRTRGNPLFATQLVGDWVQRGLLVPGQHGFQLQDATTEALPNTLHDLASEQLERLVQDPTPLEMAACLGREARVSELDALVTADEDDLRALEAAGVLGRSRQRVWFRNEVVRESLLRTAREEGRLADHHAACAAMLQRLYPDHPRRTFARLATHLAESGQHLQACPVYRRAAQEAQREGELFLAQELMERWESAAQAARLPPRDEEWGEGLLLRANIARSLEQDDEAQRLAEQCVALGRAFTWPRVLTKGVGILGQLATTRRDPKALDLLTEGARLAKEAGLTEDLASQSLGLASLLMQAGRLDEAEDRFMDILHLRNSGQGAADAMNGLGECARLRGRLDQAMELYQRAIDAPQISAYSRGVVRLNIGIVRLKRGQYREARPVIERAHQEFMRQGRVVQQAWAAALLLPGLANLAFWQAFDERLKECTTKLSTTASASPETAWALAEAARLCMESGQRRRAWSCNVLAVAQYRSVGRSEEAEAVRTQMKG